MDDISIISGVSEPATVRPFLESPALNPTTACEPLPVVENDLFP